MASRARSTAYPNERFLGDLGGLAREDLDSNQSMHQTAYAALQPLVMTSLYRKIDLLDGSCASVFGKIDSGPLDLPENRIAGQ